MSFMVLAEDGREIRLITLRWAEVKPLREDESSELQVHDAFNCELDNCPYHGHDALPGVGASAVHLPLANSYVALSYTWNYDVTVKPFVVNGHAVSIGQNLADAIQAFHRTDLVEAGYKSWADALCIDQGSIAERDREVFCMCEIYHRAKYVMSYVGPAEDNSDIAMDFANGLDAAQSSGGQHVRAFLNTTLTAYGHGHGHRPSQTSLNFGIGFISGSYKSWHSDQTTVRCCVAVGARR